jgi:poly(3-hydroxybutyrate) depolymerase
MMAALAMAGSACSSDTSPPPGSGGSQGSGGVTSQGGAPGSGGAAQPGTGGANNTGGHAGSGSGGAGTGGQPGSGGAGVGGATSTGGASSIASGGRGALGGAAGSTSQPGAGGATAAGGNPGRDGGSATDDAGSTPAGQSAGCGKAPTIASSNYNNGHHISITAAGKAREYILNVPTNYDNTKPYKFVIAYHELNGNDDEMYRNQYYHLLNLSQNSTIFVAPNGQQNGANCTQASGCGWPNTSDSDMALADAVVAQIEENFCIDTNRIFATGWSYGASMSEQTACERPLSGLGSATWGVRAIAVYSVAYLSNTDNCKASSSKPVAYYASHGTNDTVLPYSGGVSIAQTWAAADGCTAATPTQATGNHVCTNYAGCKTGYPVEFCSFVGPHTPDPTDSGGGTSWEYQNVWTFLSQF